MKSRRIVLLCSAAGMALLIFRSRETVLLASQGIDICLRTVIPSLFPFFLLSGWLTGNLTGSGVFPLLVSGFLGGYPVGARSVAEIRRSGLVSRDSANRMLMFCSQAGPSFFFGIVAAAFPQGKYAWMLWAIQILSALSVGVLAGLPYTLRMDSRSRPSVSLTGAMSGALRAMASVCGWVVFFRILLGFVSLLPMTETMEVLLSGLLELANGCLKLSAVEPVTARFLVAAVLLNFGGICVLMQTASLIQGLDLRYYLLGKLLQTCFAVLYTLVLLGYYGALVPILGVFVVAKVRKLIKRSSIPAEIGV